MHIHTNSDARTFIHTLHPHRRESAPSGTWISLFVNAMTDAWSMPSMGGLFSSTIQEHNNSPRPCGLGVLDPAHEGLLRDKDDTPLMPHGRPEGCTLEGSDSVTPLLCAVVKIIHLSRIWLTLTDPIAPGHATYAYQTNVKSCRSQCLKGEFKKNFTE